MCLVHPPERRPHTCSRSLGPSLKHPSRYCYWLWVVFWIWINIHSYPYIFLNQLNKHRFCWWKTHFSAIVAAGKFVTSHELHRQPRCEAGIERTWGFSTRVPVVVKTHPVLVGHCCRAGAGHEFFDELQMNQFDGGHWETASLVDLLSFFNIFLWCFFWTFNSKLAKSTVLLGIFLATWRFYEISIRSWRGC